MQQLSNNISDLNQALNKESQIHKYYHEEYLKGKVNSLALNKKIKDEIIDIFDPNTIFSYLLRVSLNETLTEVTINQPGPGWKPLETKFFVRFRDMNYRTLKQYIPGIIYSRDIQHQYDRGFDFYVKHIVTLCSIKQFLYFGIVPIFKYEPIYGQQGQVAEVAKQVNCHNYFAVWTKTGELRTRTFVTKENFDTLPMHKGYSLLGWSKYELYDYLITILQKNKLIKVLRLNMLKYYYDLISKFSIHEIIKVDCLYESQPTVLTSIYNFISKELNRFISKALNKEPGFRNNDDYRHNIITTLIFPPEFDGLPTDEYKNLVYFLFRCELKKAKRLHRLMTKWRNAVAIVTKTEKKKNGHYTWHALCSNVTNIMTIQELQTLLKMYNIDIPTTETTEETDMKAVMCKLLRKRLHKIHFDHYEFFEKSNQKICENETGIVSALEDIPADYWYIYKEDGKTYCDDIRHLHKSIETYKTRAGVPKNIWTTKLLSDDTVKNIKTEYKKLLDSKITLEDNETTARVDLIADLSALSGLNANIELLRNANVDQIRQFLTNLNEGHIISAQDIRSIGNLDGNIECKNKICMLLINKINIGGDVIIWEIVDIYAITFTPNTDTAVLEHEDDEVNDGDVELEVEGGKTKTKTQTKKKEKTTKKKKDKEKTTKKKKEIIVSINRL